jgi:hypothetical protein
MPRQPRDTPIDQQPSYHAWKDEAVRALQRDHGLPPTSTSERGWTQLHVPGFMPDQAADRAEMYYRNIRPAGLLWRKTKM